MQVLFFFVVLLIIAFLLYVSLSPSGINTFQSVRRIKGGTWVKTIFDKYGYPYTIWVKENAHETATQEGVEILEEDVYS